MNFFTIPLVIFLSFNLISCATNQIKQAPRKSINANFPSDVVYVNHTYENGDFFLPSYRSAPAYPRVAVENNQEGWVAFLFDVGVDGKTKNIKVVDSSPPKIFDALATKAVQTYRYKPMVKDGKVVEATNVRIIVSFEMEK